MTITYSAKFEDAVAHVFKEEAGYVNHPNDAGKATNFGITKATYADYIGKPVSQVPDYEIKAMPKSLAKQIYYEKYWQPMQGDNIENGKISKLLLSQSVNRGPSVFEDVKKELGLNSSSSSVNSEMITALNSVQNENAFLTNRIENNRKFHERLVEKDPTQRVFARGWQKRNDNDGKAVGIEPVPRYISSATIPGIEEEDLNELHRAHKAYIADPAIELINEAYNISFGEFLFNDQKLDISPEQISIMIDEYENSILLMRTENPVTTQSGRKKIRIIVSFSVDVGTGWSKLAKIITQIRKTPIATIENEKIRKELFGDQPDHENIGVIVDNISGYVEEGFPTLIRCTLQMSWFNHAPYAESLKYKEKSGKEDGVIYQTKPSSLYKKFYMEGTSDGTDTYNDPGRFLSNNESMVLLYKEYKEFSDTFVIEPSLSSNALDKRKTTIDGSALIKRNELKNKGWYFAEEDEEKLGEPIEGVWYRWRKIEIPFSDFENLSGSLLLQNVSFSLSTNPTYIGMEKYSIPTVQFLGGSTADIRAMVFAAAEHASEKDKTPIETSNKLMVLQKVLKKVSEDRIRFSKFNKENHLLMMHPIAKLMTYGTYGAKTDEFLYIDENENVSNFKIDTFLPVTLSSLESQTIPGLPFASNVQLDFKETRLGKSLKSITYKGISGSEDISNANQVKINIVKTFYDKNGIYLDLNSQLGFKNNKKIMGLFRFRSTPLIFSDANSDLNNKSLENESKAESLCDALNTLRFFDQNVYDFQSALNSELFKLNKDQRSSQIQSAEDISVSVAKNKIGRGEEIKSWSNSFRPEWIDQFVVSLYLDFIDGLNNGASWVYDYLRDFEQYSAVRPQDFGDLYSDMKIPKDQISPAFYFADNEKRVKNFKNNILKNMPNNYAGIEQKISQKLHTDFPSQIDPGLKKSQFDHYPLAYNYSAKKEGNGTGAAKIHPIDSNNYRIFATQQAIAEATPPTYSLAQVYPTFQVQLFSNRYAYGQAESASDLSINKISETRQLDLLDVFDLSSIIDIKIIKDQYEAADAMIIRVLATKKTLLTKQKKDPTYNPETFSVLQLFDDIASGKTTGAGINNNNLSEMGLQEGTRIRCLLGNSAISGELGLEFNGRIAAINGKDVIEIYCVGDGHELIQNTMGFPGEDEDREYTLNSDTVELIKEIIGGANEVKSFGNTGLEVFPNINFNLPDFLGGRSAFDNIYAPTIFPKHTTGQFLSGAFNTSLNTFSIGAGVTTTAIGIKATLALIGSASLITLGAGVAAVAGIGLLAESLKVLSQKLSPCKFVVYKQTIWDVVQELTLRHPGYITAVVPFDRRSTLYFGEPDGIYFHRGIESAAERALVAMAMIKSKNIFKTATLREIYENNLNEKKENPDTIQSDSQFITKNKKNEQKTFSEGFISKNIESENLMIMNMQKPFRAYHLITSENDIISNDIEASSVDVANSVQVYYPKDDNEGNPDGTTWFSNYKLTDYMKADDDLHSNLINNKVFTFHNAHNEDPEIELPQRYAKAILCKELENIYKGKITILGRHGIKPHDIVIINDTHNRISGPVKVGRVIQSISSDGGWTTTIYPKFIAIPDTSAGAFQMKAILKATRYWLTTSTQLFYSNMKKFTPDEEADNDKSMRELMTALDIGLRGGENISEEELTEDFDKFDLERIGEESSFGSTTEEALEETAFLSGQVGGSLAAGVMGDRRPSGTGIPTKNFLKKNKIEVDGFSYKKNTAGQNLELLKRKGFKDVQSMMYQKEIKKSLSNLALKRNPSAALKVAGTTAKGVFKAGVTGGKLLFRTGVGFFGGFILEGFLSSLAEGMISYMKYRQPISIFPLTKEGRPWMAALNGYKENSIIEHLELSATVAADKMGMTSYVLQTMFKQWTEGMPPDIGMDAPAEVVEVTDGDTFIIKGNPNETIRIKNVNTAETPKPWLVGKKAGYVEPGEIEKGMAYKAKNFIKELLLNPASKITLNKLGPDSTGKRTEATVKVNGVDLRTLLLGKGLATPTVINYRAMLPPELRDDPEAIREVREREWGKIKSLHDSINKTR